MSDLVPKFTNEQIAIIAEELYGIKGTVSPFVSFEDQNALVKSDKGNFVLKIANKRWAEEFVQAQSDVMAYLKENAPDMTFPSVIPTLSGEEMTFVNGFAVRMLTFLEGELLAQMPRSPELYQDAGRFLGQFSKVMKNFKPDNVEGSDPYWKLDNVMVCKEFLPEVIDEDARERIARLYDVYEEKILPRLPGMRKAVIHGDANEQNFLISPDNPKKISGLIDFGELQYGSQINELAITLAYGLLGEDDIDMAFSKVVEGYEKEFPLLDQEREILKYLMAMRLVTNINMTSHQSKQQPDNKYILISQEPARALLKKLEEEKYILA